MFLHSHWSSTCGSRGPHYRTRAQSNSARPPPHHKPTLWVGRWAGNTEDIKDIKASPLRATGG